MNPPKPPDSLLVHINPIFATTAEADGLYIAKRWYISCHQSWLAAAIFQDDFFFLLFLFLFECQPRRGARRPRAEMANAKPLPDLRHQKKKEILRLNKEKLRLFLKLWQKRIPNKRRKVPPLVRRVRNRKAAVH